MEGYLVPIAYEYVRYNMRLRAYVNGSSQLLPDGIVEGLGPDANGEPFVYVRCDDGGLWNVDINTMRLIVPVQEPKIAELIKAARIALKWLCTYGPKWRRNGPEGTIECLRLALKEVDPAPAYDGK